MNETPLQNGTMGKFPNGVAAALEAADISQAELARRVDESRQQIGRIVKCERKLTLAMATKLAPVLNVDVRELFVPADHQPLDQSGGQGEFLAEKARLLDQIASFSPDQQAEILSEALSMMARRQRTEP